MTLPSVTKLDLHEIDPLPGDCARTLNLQSSSAVYNDLVLAHHLAATLETAFLREP
jgi:hypothetical protein